MAPRTYWVAPIPPMNFADGTPSTALSLTDITPTPNKPMPNPEQGSILRLRAHCEVTSTSTTPTLLLGFYWGGIGGVALATATALVMPIVTSGPVIMEYEGEFRILGTSGQIKGAGKVYMCTSLTGLSLTAIPATAAARTVTVSTAAGLIVNVGATWSSATGTPSITCTHFNAEMVG